LEEKGDTLYGKGGSKKKATSCFQRHSPPEGGNELNARAFSYKGGARVGDEFFLDRKGRGGGLISFSKKKKKKGKKEERYYPLPQNLEEVSPYP